MANLYKNVKLDLSTTNLTNVIVILGVDPLSSDTNIDLTIIVEPVGAVIILVKLVVDRSNLTFLYKFAISIGDLRP